MKFQKKINVLSAVATFLFLVYNFFILLSALYPGYAVFLLGLKDLYPDFDDYEEELMYYEDEGINLFFIALNSVFLFGVSAGRLNFGRSLSKRSGMLYLVFSAVFLTGGYVSLAYAKYHYYGNMLFEDNLYLLSLLFVIQIVGEMLLTCSCVYEIFLCETGLYAPAEHKTGGFSTPVKVLSEIFAVIIGIILILTLKLWAET